MVQRREFRVCSWEFLVCRIVKRPVDPALQQLRGAVGAPEHIRDRLDMAGLSGMTGTEQGDLRGRVAEPRDAAPGNERQRLERLQRAARRGQMVRIPGREQYPPTAIDDGDRPIVDAVDGVATRDDRQRNVRRGRASNLGQRRGSCRKPLL